MASEPSSHEAVIWNQNLHKLEKIGLNSAKEHEIQSSSQLKQLLNGWEKLFMYKNIKLIEKVPQS